jgi:hypothetical protein
MSRDSIVIPHLRRGDSGRSQVRNSKRLSLLIWTSYRRLPEERQRSPRAHQPAFDPYCVSLAPLGPAPLSNTMPLRTGLEAVSK